MAGTRPLQRKDLPFQVAVHDGKKDLQEKIDGIYEDREQV